VTAWESIRKVGATVPVSREMLLSMGLAQPTAEEIAEREASERRWREEQAAAYPLTVAYADALDAVTDEPARAVLRLHGRQGDFYPTCEGCDFAGYEGEAPGWPCRTVDAIADHYGITKPDRLAFEEPS
jgi:hypothetical protein